MSETAQPEVSESDNSVEKSDTEEKLDEVEVKKELEDDDMNEEEDDDDDDDEEEEENSELTGQQNCSSKSDLSNQPLENADGDDASMSVMSTEEIKSQEDSKEDSNLSAKKDSISPSALLDDNATTHSDNTETETNETGPVRSASPDAHSDSESKQSFFEKIGLLGEGMKMKKSSETLDKNVMHREYGMYDESAFPAVDLDENGLPINADDMNEEDREKREKKLKFVKEISALRRMLLTKGFIRGSKWRPTPSYIKQRDIAMSGKKGFGAFSLDRDMSDESTPDSSMDGSPSRTIYRQDGSASARIYHLDGNPSATIYRPDGSPSANIYCQDGGTSATIYRKGVSRKRGPVKEMMKRCRPCKVGLTDFFKELDIDVSELSKDFPLVKRIKVIDYNSQANNPPSVEQDSYEGSFLSFISNQSDSKSPGKNFKRTSYSKQWTEGNENRTVTVSKLHCNSSTPTLKSSTSPPRFSCVHCQYSCQEKELMTEHIYAHITTKVFRCGICGLDFTTFGTAAIHHQAVHQFSPQKIEKTAEIDETEHYLEIRENLSDDENKQPSNETNKGEEAENKSNDDNSSSDEKSSKSSPVFISVVVNGNKQANDKKIVVEVPDRFQCTYCKFSTDQREIMQQHTAAEHTGAVHYTCTLCDGLVLTSKANLLSHYNTVHPGKTIKCRKLPDFTDTEEPQHPVEPPTNRYNRYRSNIYGRGGLLTQGRFGSTDGVSASGTDMGLKIVNVVSLHSGRHSGQSRRPGSGSNNNCIIPPEGFMVPVLLNAKTMSLKYASSSANRKCKYPGDDDPLISRSIYMCKKCGCEAKFLSQMQDHIINSHSAFCMYTCAYCTFKGEKEADIYKHINIAHSECDGGVPLSFFLDPVYITKYIANIEKNQQTRYKEKLVGKLSHYKCRVCSQEFPDGISLYMHSFRVHDKKLSYHCPYCTEYCSDTSDPMRDHVSSGHGKDISSEAVFAFICDGKPNRDANSILSPDSSSAGTTPVSVPSKPPEPKSFRKDDDVVILPNSPLKAAGQQQSVIRPFTPRGRSRGRPPRSQTILLRNMLQARANASSSPSSSGPLQPMMIVANAAHEENQGSPPIVIDHPERTPKPMSLTDSSTPEPTGDGTLDMDCETVDEDNPVDSVVEEDCDASVGEAATVSKSVPLSSSLHSKSSKRQTGSTTSRSASHQLSELAARSAAEHSADIIPSQPFPLKVIKKENDMYLTTDTSLHNDQVVPVSLQAAQGAVPLDLSSTGANESDDMPPDAFKVFNLSPAASQLASYLPTTPNTYSSPVPVGPPIQTADYSSSHSLSKTTSSEDRYNKEIYRCDKCNFKTTYRAALKTHHTFRHSQIYKCPYCPDTVPLDSFEVEPHIKQLHPDEKIAYMRI